jgi:2-C-methyl-D-erythritol 4-phosphate cytidylyltransferase/2-C-methyl-D-erythritol 2,4-cyclodiphosphate synthase
VLIHDAARPYTTPAMLDRLLDELLTCRGAVLASPATDTIKQATPELLIGKTLPRERLWRAETPQGFRFKDIVAAHRQAARDTSASFTDDASIAEWAGIPVSLVDSGGHNTKITTAEDLAMAELRLGSKSRHAPADIRTGQGFDVHRFKDSGDHVWLCGVRIPFHRGVEAHSDGDVALHALTDALLGAIADGDIGQHFSNNDPRWRNAASRLFVSDAVARVGRRGGLLRHVDITILAEAPKIGPHREAMRAEVARLTGLSLDRVGLKATTTEQLGFVGRGDGLAALATATVAM